MISELLPTPALGCPACEVKRLHTDEERAQFHPFAGCGYTKETGWKPPELEPK